MMRCELLIGQLADGRQALGDNFVVAAVGAEDEVVHVQGISLADRGCLLTDGKVGGAGIGEIPCRCTAPCSLMRLQHGLKLADGDHVGIHAQELFLGEVLFLDP